MKTKLTILLSLFVITLFAQKNLPVINATSKLVDIREGDEFSKGQWTLVPEMKPDIYITNNKNAKVTFYTDQDSISFVARPGEAHDFVILLNGKDSAFTQVIYVPPYLETLKMADKYNLTDKRSLPPFTYQSSDNPNLKALREGFNLDSIAGTGNEVSQILNVLHWIHELIPHDGNNGNPQIKNAMSMIQECKASDRGLNCRGLATVLNECYLSMGIPSRFVTCLPKDSLGIDMDCHVINMVYAKSLEKWLWIDPTHDAYVMNEKGELLSIQEVRERVINDEPIILNPTANWNHKSSTLKENYIYNYMAKNLYMFECPVHSEYDTETRKKGKQIDYIKLLPLDYFKQLPDKTKYTNKKSGTKFTTYKTNNPNLFWQAPANLQQDTPKPKASKK